MQKTALITGGTSGLGKALAIKLAKKDYSVAIVGRDPERLRSVVEEASSHTKQVIKALPCEFANENEVDGLFEKAQQALGNSIELLVNNAGYSVLGSVEDVPLDEMKRCWNVNFVSAVNLTKQALPEMLKLKKGMIVNISSGTAFRAVPYESAYCSSKAALKSFSESLRVEVEKSGVQILIFSPGPLASSFFDARPKFGNSHSPSIPFKGQDPKSIAENLYKAILARKKVVTLGWKAQMVSHLNQFSPILVDKLMKRIYKT